jgi:hypothetical protein
MNNPDEGDESVINHSLLHQLMESVKLNNIELVQEILIRDPFLINECDSVRRITECP